MVEETAMASERLLVMKEVGDDHWQCIKSGLAAFEVDLDDGPFNIWDVRDRGSEDDRIYLWGRDGWREGFWHAVFTKKDTHVWVERGQDARADSLLQSKQRFVLIVEPLLLKQEKASGEATEHLS